MKFIISFLFITFYVFNIYCAENYTKLQKPESKSNIMVHKFGNSSYIINNIYMNWHDAFKYCVDEGYHLAVVNTEEEAQYLSKLINATSGSDAYFSIGFHDMFSEGYYYTVQGETLDEAGYNTWAENEPNGGTKENCGSLHYTGGLNDIKCEGGSLPFICEFNQVIH